MKKKRIRGKEGKGREESNECCDSVTVSNHCECIEEQWVVYNAHRVLKSQHIKDSRP
jgi:hypothetical protein